MGRERLAWKGLTSVVTGASSGIGRELALRLARRGARVALVARRRERLEALADEIRRHGGEALPVACDVASREGVAAAAALIVQALGPIDLLVNNAGVGRHRRFLDWEVSDIERMMAINYLGTVYWTKALLPQMVERRRGWLVFMSSAAGRIGTPDESAYVATKFALAGLAESLGLEVEPLGIHTLTVFPGALRTELLDAESLARMPAVARRMLREPQPLVERILKALESGRREVVYPWTISAGFVVRTLAPGFFRRMLRRTTLGAERPDLPPPREQRPDRSSTDPGGTAR
ncbi:MAG: SDR family NAD(P)-dependent oxidoreductase [Myxococcota bacterium]